MSHSVALHESAHAVIARVLGLSCGSVTIEPHTAVRGKESDGRLTLVQEQVLAHAEIALRWYPKRKASQEECAEAFAIALYAGAEAERVICGKQEHNDADDREQAAAVLPDAVHREPELRARANALVHEHRSAIELVAQTLLESKTLIPMEVDAVLQLAAAMAELEELPA